MGALDARYLSEPAPYSRGPGMDVQDIPMPKKSGRCYADVDRRYSGESMLVWSFASAFLPIGSALQL